MIMTAIFIAQAFVAHAHLRMGIDNLRAFSVAADGNAVQFIEAKKLQVHAQKAMDGKRFPTKPEGKGRDENAGRQGYTWEDDFDMDSVALNFAGTWPSKVDARSKNTRPCGRESCNGHRRSLIILHEALVRSKAGLNDRFSVMQGVGDLAASLCARVAIGRPCDTLGRHGTVPCTDKWSRYRSIAMWDGSESVFVEDDAPAELRALGACNASSERVCVSGGDIKAIAKICGAKARKLQFTWHLPPYYQFRSYVTDTMAGSSEFRNQWAIEWPLCSSVQQGPSDDVNEGANRALQLLHVTAGEFCTLHIRRGDLLQHCNTSVASVMQYGRKAILPFMQASNLAEDLLVFTDEIDGTYLDEVQAGLQALGVDARFGDSVIRQAIASETVKENNMITYAVVREIVKRSKKHFAMDHLSCPTGI